ncbi:MAG: hypothetical protein GMKNLPBB_01275 [Myxococcota bacterium]|nr:hypothetical protein [Myxococcota bacterium]
MTTPGLMIAALLLLFPGAAFADDFEKLLDKARDHYRAGRYAEAADSLEDARRLVKSREAETAADVDQGPPLRLTIQKVRLLKTRTGQSYPELSGQAQAVGKIPPGKHMNFLLSCEAPGGLRKGVAVPGAGVDKLVAGQAVSWVAAFPSVRAENVSRCTVEVTLTGMFQQADLNSLIHSEDIRLPAAPARDGKD